MMVFQPDTGPRSKKCAFVDCAADAKIQCWLVVGDADSMGATWNGMCAQHAGPFVARLTRELLRGGPCKSLMIVLP
jgi:hypothetical protein